MDPLEEHTASFIRDAIENAAIVTQRYMENYK